MRKPIDNVAQAREVIRKLLVVLYEVKPPDPINCNIIDYCNAELDELLSNFKSCFYDVLPQKERNKNQDIGSLGFLIQEYKSLEGETEASLLAKNKDSIVIASALDSMRIFTNYLVETINKERNKKGLAPFKKPLFEYKMNQPKDSYVEIIPKKILKSKSSDHINFGHYPFDLGELKDSQLHKDKYQKVFKEINYFKLGEKVLILRTRGDNFVLYKNRTGYSGDWQEHHILRKENTTIEVDRIMIIHFFEGEKSISAHVYLADYDYHELQTQYIERRYKYWFKNIVSCGYIEANFINDFESAIVEIVGN